jgi:hypothetical protein
MYGGFGSWLYTTVGGLDRMPGSRGWTNLLINPAVSASPNVTSASTSIDTPVGLAAVEWTTDVPNNGQCGFVAENSVLNLTCITKDGSAGTFTAVNFASFGTPAGSCPNFSAGACNSNNSVSVVTSLCVGKSTCSIPATNTQFGGDPCVNTPKSLAVSLTGNCLQIQYQVSPTVPVGSQANVMVDLTGASASAVTVYEGTSVVWTNGAFVPGVPGVTGATASPDGTSLLVTTGSGNYKFSVAK